MKIGILKNRNKFGHKGGNETYTHLLIENSGDVMVYNKILANKNAHTNTDLWFAFKSQNFRESISDYMVHENTGNAAETILLTTKLDFKETDTSLLEFCEISDNIVSDKCTSILKYINNGHIVRINKVGGYCFIDNQDINEYDELYEPTVEQLNSFIYFGDVNMIKYNITKETVIIENSVNVSGDFKDKLVSVDIKEFNELTNFKNVIRTYNDKEIVELFINGIKKGLENICFETSGQDLHQIMKMKTLLSKVEELSGVKMNLYIKTWNKQVIGIFKDFNVIEINKK